MDEASVLLKSFSARLRELKVRSGEPSYMWLSKTSSRLARSTISDVLRGQSPPSIDFLVAFVGSCRLYAHQSGMPQDRTEHDVEVWRKRWSVLRQKLAHAKSRGADDDGPDALAFELRPRQMPASPSNFVGRRTLLAQLTEWSLSEASYLTQPTVITIDGQGGVGKTALAVQWAHDNASYFPDGQIHLNLGGFGSSQAVTAEAALDHLLRSIGVKVGDLPHTLDLKSALWRTVAADRRVLLVLDNADSSEQVRPLLPHTSSSVVLVTSRQRLDGLVVREGSHSLHVPVLSVDEARELIVLIAGLEDAAHADQLAMLCGHSPLAIRIAANTRQSPTGLTAVCEELRTKSKLDVLLTYEGDPYTDVRNVLTWSYRRLPPRDAAIFRMLSVHAPRRIESLLLAAIAGAPLDEIEALVGRLHASNLIEGPDAEVHDLIRELAKERLEADTTADVVGLAQQRQGVWFLHTVSAADTLFSPWRQSFANRPVDGMTPRAFANVDDALGWCDAHVDVFGSIVQNLVDLGDHDLAWRLALALLSYFNLRKPYSLWIKCYNIGLSSAAKTEDQFAVASMANGLAIALRETQQIEASLERSRLALSAYEATGDGPGQSNVLNNIGSTYSDLEDDTQALSYYQRGLDVAVACGYENGEGNALHNLAQLLLDRGELDQAADLARRELGIFQRQADRYGQTFPLMTLAEINARRRNYSLAINQFREVLTIKHGLGDVLGEGTLWFWLGRAHIDNDNKAEGAECIRLSIRVLESIGHPLVDKVRAYATEHTIAE